MVDVTKAMESNYLTADVVKQGATTGTIVSEGKFEDTDYGQKLTLIVSLGDREKVYRPNRDSVTNLAQAYGRDSKLWFQKPVNFKTTRIQGKDCIIATGQEELAMEELKK